MFAHFFSMCTTSCIDGKVDKTHQHCMFLPPALLFSFEMHSSSFWGQKIDPGLFKSLFCWEKKKYYHETTTNFDLKSEQSNIHFF